MFRNYSVNTLWELKAESKQGTITCVDCYEFNGEDHLLIGRQSGSVEVYSLESHCVPITKYKYVILFIISPINLFINIFNVILELFRKHNINSRRSYKKFWFARNYCNKLYRLGYNTYSVFMTQIRIYQMQIILFRLAFWFNFCRPTY